MEFGTFKLVEQNVKDRQCYITQNATALEQPLTISVSKIKQVNKLFQYVVLENLQALKMKQSMRCPCGPASTNHNYSELGIIYYDKSIYHVF